MLRTVFVRGKAMSEQDAGRGPEHFALEEVEKLEPERLPPPNAAHAACDEDRDDLDTDTEDASDVELADGSEIDGLSGDN